MGWRLGGAPARPETWEQRCIIAGRKDRDEGNTDGERSVGWWMGRTSWDGGDRLYTVAGRLPLWSPGAVLRTEARGH